MHPREPRSNRALRALGNTLVALVTLTFVGPALAEGGNLAVKLVELELGGPDRFVLCDDANANGQCETAEEELVQNIVSGQGKKGCELSLVGDPVVDLTSAAGPPGIDANKGAIGDRDNKGTGCGRLEHDDILDVHFLGRAVVESRVQFEAKQNVAGEIIFKLAGAEVGKRYFISGNATAPSGFPPTGSPDILLCNVGSSDGNPDSGESDDCLLYLSRAGGAESGASNPEPLHDEQSYFVLNDGALSLKAGSEFAFPDENRSVWRVVEFDGLLNCGDSFSCTGDPDCVSGVSGNRTEEETGDACTNPIPFELKFNGRLVVFNFLDTNNQNPGVTFDVEWETQATGRDPLLAPGAQYPLEPTILSYDANGVACGIGSCSNDAAACQLNSDCDPGNTCVLPVTESCIPLTFCVGTPIRRCSNDSSLGCREDEDCGPGNTCGMDDLVAPAPDGFPDLLPSSTSIEYGCVCEEHALYLGPGVCDDQSGDLAGTSCEDDSVCGSGGSCELFARCDDASGALVGTSCGENADCVDGANAGACVPGDELALEQCLFFTGDAHFKRGGRTF